MPSLKSISSALTKLQQPEIIYEPALCSRIRWRNSPCNICQQGCAPMALQFTPQLELDESKCTSCGLCISRCPNGVFWSRRRGDSTLAQEIASFLSNNGSKTAIFGCALIGRGGKNICCLPCLGRLTENLLVAPLAFGANRVEVWWPDCHGCENEKCLSHLKIVLLLGRKLAAMVGQEEDCIQVVKTGRYSEVQATPSFRLSRREFFRSLGGKAKQTTAAFLPEFSNHKLASPWVHIIGAKRAHLLQLVRGFPRHTPVSIETKGLPLGEVTIHPGCVGCPVCATLCPTGALERIENPDGVDIYFRPEICLGCHICQESCRFKAIALSATFDLQKLAIGERQHLMHLSRKGCRECDTDFLSTDEEICPACRQQHGDIALLSGRRGQNAASSLLHG